MDEPVKEELPEFEARLAKAIAESINDESKANADCVSKLSWENILKKVLE